MTIRTYSEPTPWGIEWYAIDDDIYDGAFDSKMNIAGVGSTEAEALADLKERLEEMFCPECGSGPGEPHAVHCDPERRS